MSYPYEIYIKHLNFKIKILIQYFVDALDNIFTCKFDNILHYTLILKLTLTVYNGFGWIQICHMMYNTTLVRVRQP